MCSSCETTPCFPPGLRCLLTPPLRPERVLPHVRQDREDAQLAHRHPHSADRAHGIGLLHGGPDTREVPGRLLPIPAQEVSVRFSTMHTFTAQCHNKDCWRDPLKGGRVPRRMGVAPRERRISDEVYCLPHRR